jgi:hypothetical protein
MKSGSAKDRRKKKREEMKRTSANSFQPRVEIQPKGVKKRLAFPVKRIVTTVAAVLGLVSGIITLFNYLVPNLTIALNDQVNSDDSLSYRFILKNEGHLELSNLALSCWFITATDKHGGGWYNSSSSAVPDTRLLKVGEPTNVRCGTVYGFELERGDIQLIIRYRYFWGLLRGTKRSRYEVVMGDDGRLHWEPKPSASESKQLDGLLDKLSDAGHI